MSLRKDMEKATKDIIKEVHAEDVEIEAFIKDQFNKMLKHCKSTETSVNTATVEILEGMEEGLKTGGKDIQASFRKIASTMFKVAPEQGK